MATEPVRVEPVEDGRIWRVFLNVPKANILDGAMTRALTDVFGRAETVPELAAVVLEGEGPHFCFGASVAEHLPDQVAGMLATFHGLFRAMARSAVTCVAAVRGQCLGGGLELASFCHRVFASPEAKLGQPEIRLAVFAPVASVFLAERMGRGAAEEVCLTGRVLDAREALATGLVDAVAEDPAEAALAWARTHLLPASASSLRFAVRAARQGLYERLFADLDAVEKLYLEKLMATEDAVEGIRSFLEKRKPTWRHR